MANERQVPIQPPIAVQRSRGFDGGAEFVIGPINASAAAVVNSLVFEAGVKSLPEFCE